MVLFLIWQFGTFCRYQSIGWQVWEFLSKLGSWRTFVRNFCVEIFRYFHTELLWRTFVRNFRVELSLYFHTELSCGTFLVFSQGTFWKLLLKLLAILLAELLWELSSSEEPFKFCCLVFNSESLGQSFTGLPRRPTLRVCTNLSADLVDFHFSNL